MSSSALPGSQDSAHVLTVREVSAEELPILKTLAPPDWNTDLSAVFARHYGQPYYHPIAAEVDGRVVGCAQGLLQGNAGWLGNIVVLPEFRGRGIGRKLTEHLVGFFRAHCMDYQILVATSMGEPIYRKLGFTISSYYVFLERAADPTPAEAVPGVRLFEPRDQAALLALDRAVTGETRGAFVRRYLPGAWVRVNAARTLDGYYLPELGTGLVIASNEQAGLALLSYRLGQPGKVCVVPEGNQVALDFLLQHGFVETSRAPRMTLGPEINWHPEQVYCRGSGFAG